MLTRALVAMVVATTLIMSTGDAARAETATHHDRLGDVRHPLDITRVAIKNRNALIVRIKHRDLREAGSVSIFVDVTPKAHHSPDYMLTSGVGTHYDLFWMRSWDRTGGFVRGCWYDASHNYRRDITRFRVGRMCLSGATFRATKVRVAAIAANNRGANRDWSHGYRKYSRWLRQY